MTLANSLHCIVITCNFFEILLLLTTTVCCCC